MLQCQAAVKVPGSFRPVAGSEHLYSHCNFAESLVETVPKSLRHSCRSELHPIPGFPRGIDYAFISLSWFRIIPGSNLRLPLGFIVETIWTIDINPSRWR